MTSKSRNARDGVRDLIETRGLKAAALALIEVCEDKKAPAPARATAGTTLLRAGGLFEKIARPEEKEAYELTGEELEAAVSRIRGEQLADGLHDDNEEDRGVLE